VHGGGELPNPRRLTVLPNPLRRAATLLGALSLLALAGPISSASAVVETSEITTPGTPTYTFYDATATPPTPLKVEGTTNVSKLALRCYYDYGPSAAESFYATLVEEVTPSGGTFSVEVPVSTLPSGPCVLRAVPYGTAVAYPPGAASEEAAAPFKGPRVVGSRFALYGEKGLTDDYELEASTQSSYLAIDSAGDCGLDYSAMFAPETLAAGHLFDCNAALYQENSVPPGAPNKPTRSELQIDGNNAYSPASAHDLNEIINEELRTKKEAEVIIPGAPQVTVTKKFNSASRLATITEVDPIVKCSPSTAFPPTVTSCKEFVPTGVQLEREWQTSDGDQVASMTDKWSSTNGLAHSLNALYDQATVNEGPKGGAYQFAGTNVFSSTTAGETVALPAGVGKIYYKSDAETPAAGDGLHPQGAIVYDTPPSEPIAVYHPTTAKGEEGTYNGFVMPYQATIPASGAYTLHMTFIQAYKLSEVETLTAETLEHFPASPGPSLSIAAPASGTVVTTPNVTVSGTLTDPRAITSFTVDGQPVAVGAGGAWSTTVPLVEGANTIDALATDQAGLSAKQTVSVTYTPTPPVAHASQVGTASGANGEVKFTIACNGSAGTSCEVESTVTTVEKTRNGRLVAVSARRHAHGNRSTTVTVGASKVTIPAGQRVTVAIALNATGANLLARFGKLPVRLAVVLVSSGHRSKVIAQNLTVTAHRKQHRHHHHRRHRR
jgi:hypothetical protein